jgi:hypothetical protein
MSSTYHVLRPRAAFGQYRHDVLQRLPRLRSEACRKFLVFVPADHAADENIFAAGLDAVGIALRRRPAGRLQGFVFGTRRQFADRSGGHGQLL